MEQNETRHKTVKQPVKKGVAKVPVVMQMEALECGAASLTMIMAYYGKWIPLEVVRKDCGVSRDGSNARNILRAARSYGMEVRCYRLEPDVLRDEGSFPCIVHWEFNHFIVVDGFKNGRVYVNDPARGDYNMSYEEFDEGFTGITMFFEPTENFVPSGHKKSILGFARKRLHGAGPAVAMVMMTTIIAALSGIIMTGFSRVYLDEILSQRNPSWLMPFLGLLMVLSLVQIVAGWIEAVYMMRVDGKMAVVGSSTFLWKVLKLPMEFFSQRYAGDLQLRQSDNEVVANNIVNILAPLALNSMMMVFYLVVILRYSPLLTLIGVGSAIANLAVSNYISAKRVNITRVMMRDSGKLAGATVSGIEMIESIKAGGAENGYFEKWAGYQASVNTQNIHYAKLDAYIGLIPQVLTTLSNQLVLLLGVFLILRGRFTVGMLMAFQGFLTSFMQPVQSLIDASQSLQEMRTQMERIEDVMEYPEQQVFREEEADPEAEKTAEDTDADAGLDADEEDAYAKLTGNITMKGVTFGYSRLADPLIENFDLNLKQGGSVAFVGSSGCGKSTLAKLLSGLYLPWEGEILFDGKPISQIDHSVFTGSVAVVDQDITLFEDTIANNIKMWDNSIEDFEMILAARDAHLHEDIMQREGGYQYRLSAGGRDFSGGQKQRMEIARVLAQDPTIVIMDEATSALDARTEYEVVKSIRERGITTVVIAHRLSTIRDCDEIIVLDQGKVVERGTHEELMKLGGYYTRLITSE